MTPSITSLIAAIAICLTATSAAAFAAEYRVGIASREINPRKPTVIIGPASSPVHADRYNDLHVKATVIQGPADWRVTFVSADILHFEADQVDRLKEAIEARFNLIPDAVLFNASHNHSGPPLSTLMISSPDKLDLDYVAHFDKQLLGVVEDAIAAMRPAAISLVEDTCDVAVNRRRTVNGRTSNAPNPDGPVDRAVQVLAFRDPDTQKPFGLLVKYACHPVTTSMFAVGSSYPGLMMDTLQARHAGLTVQFLQGCSGDCRPALIGEDPTKFIPGTLDLAKSFGTRLADAVDRALAKPGRQIKGPIDTRYTQIDLPIRPVERPEFAAAANSNAWHIQRWGQKYLAQLDAGRPLDTKVPFRIQAVRLGQAPDAACLIVAFDGEIFAGYSHHIQKRLAPTPTIALGYANAMAGYIPTAEAFPKGGYEVNAYPVWDHPGPFLPSIESQILKTAQSLAQSLLP